jgi:hypothetical protein
MSDRVPAVPDDSSYDEIARKLMEENANAIRAVYEAVLADPRTKPRQRARAEARIQQLDATRPHAVTS